MTTETKDMERTNVHTNIFQIKFLINKENVVSIDNKNVHECYFIEDIFSICMVGRLTFTDDIGLYEYGPLTGNELISIRYGRNKIREIIFRVVGVKRIASRGNVGTQVSPIIQIDLADITFERFISQKFSRSYEANQKNTEVVRHIIRNMVGWDNLDIINSTSELKENFCIPYWSPKDAIDWILSPAYTNTHYGYLCYGNTYNRHTISVKPLTYLLSKENVMDSDVYNLETKTEEEDISRLDHKILEWWIDGLNHRRTREFRNTKWLDSDITTKKVNTVDFSFDEGMKFIPILGEYSLFDNNYSFNKLEYTDIRTKSGRCFPIPIKKYAINDFVKRYSLQQTFNIMVIGNEKRYAGHQIYIEWMSVDQKSKTKNRMYDGVYLVKSITHDFLHAGSPFGYIQRMVLIKNGFQNPTTRGLKKSIINNTTGGVKSNQFRDA